MAMRVQKVVAPGGETSWTVVDDVFEAVEPIEAYLAHLEAIERSPNTLRAYASSLRLFFDFLAGRAVAWDEVGLEDVGRFVSWLRRPSDEVVIPIDTAGVPARTASTVNRHLAAVFAFYEFHARRGLGWRPSWCSGAEAGAARISRSWRESVVAPERRCDARCGCGHRGGCPKR